MLSSQISLEQAEQVFKETLKRIPLGACNQGHLNKYVAEKRIDFIREFIEVLEARFDPNMLAFQIITAIFSTAVQAGNCGEQTAIAFTQLVNHASSKEILSITSKIDDDDHAFMVLNRDIANTPINKPEEWNIGTILFDTWGNKLYEITKTTVTFKIDIAKLGNLPGRESDLTIASDISHAGHLKPTEIKEINQFLISAKDYLEKTGKTRFEKIAEKVGWFNIKIDELLKTILEMISQKIHELDSSNTIEMKRDNSNSPTNTLNDVKKEDSSPTNSNDKSFNAGHNFSNSSSNLFRQQTQIKTSAPAHLTSRDLSA